MTRTAAEIGLANQQIGASFESWLDGQHSFARSHGILAHIVHNQAKTAMVKGQVQYVGSGISDYTGTLDRIGLSYAAEAKSTKDASLPRAKVKKLQQDHLETLARAGALALLLVEFRPESGRYRRYAVPWLEVPWQIKRTAQSVYEKDLQAWLIKPDTCYLARFHSPGIPTSSTGQRKYARE